MSNQDTPQIEFRNALGKFATGVTIITTLDSVGEPVGLTASSFNSLSLDPPLILWSLDKKALSMKAFEQAENFNVHVLTHKQSALSNHFARKGEDKFAGIDWECPEGGSPTLGDYAALFNCKTRFQYEGGDHIIFVGEVVGFQTRQAEPLIFRGGRYADVMEKPQEIETKTIDIETGTFSRNFLLYLVARSHFQSFNPIREQFIKDGLSQVEYFCLSALSTGQEYSRQKLCNQLAHTGFEPDDEIFARLLRKELIAESNETVSISTKGQELFVDLLESSHAVEEAIKNKFSDIELAQLRALLTKLVSVTNDDIPDLWDA